MGPDMGAWLFEQMRQQGDVGPGGPGYPPPGQLPFNTAYDAATGAPPLPPPPVAPPISSTGASPIRPVLPASNFPVRQPLPSAEPTAGGEAGASPAWTGFVEHAANAGVHPPQLPPPAAGESGALAANGPLSPTPMMLQTPPMQVPYPTFGSLQPTPSRDAAPARFQPPGPPAVAGAQPPAGAPLDITPPGATAATAGKTPGLADRLAGALKNVKAPPPPEAQKISTPRAPDTKGGIKSGQLLALLEAMSPRVGPMRLG